MKSSVELCVIKTKECVYLETSSFSYSIDRYRFDDIAGKPTFHREWCILKSIPQKITHIVQHEDINHRYELIDKSMKTQTIKSAFKRDEVAVYDEEDYCWTWIDKYAHLKSLYCLVSDSVPDTEEIVDFKIVTIFEVDKIEKLGGFKYKIQKGRYESEGVDNLTECSLKSQLIDKIVFPEILLPIRPCKLSSRDMYKIVRQHIKDNINSKYAEITSDYNFCFTVKKKIGLFESEKYTIDVNAFSMRKRKPKYETRYRKSRFVEVFAMTYSPENYKGYTAISGVQADNHEKLKEKIDAYLKELIDFINEPLVDCPKCKGRGVKLVKINGASE